MATSGLRAAISVPERVAYKGMMLEGVPNLAFAIGYTNASWTLKDAGLYRGPIDEQNLQFRPAAALVQTAR